MFSAIGRLIKNLFYLVTGQMNKVSRKMEIDPTVVNETFNAELKKRQGQIQQFQTAIAEIMVITDKKQREVISLKKDIEKWTQLKSGAARKLGILSQGMTREEAEQNPEFVKVRADFNNFASTLEEKKTRLTDIEADIELKTKALHKHENDLRQMNAGLQRLEQEKSETKADIILAQQTKHINETLAQLGEFGHSEQLEGIRQQRETLNAEAKLASTLNATEPDMEADYLAESGKYSDELEGLLSFRDAEPVVASSVAEGKLPE